MATGQVKGTYNEKSEDGNTQASNKFQHGHNKSTDAGEGKTQAINKPKDSGE